MISACCVEPVAILWAIAATSSAVAFISSVLAAKSSAVSEIKTAVLLTSPMINLRLELDDEAREAIMAVFQEKGYVEAIKTMIIYLEEYAKTNYIGYYELGDCYYRVGNLDKLIECYIKGYEIRDPMMPYMTLPFMGFDQIKEDPRIVSIVEEMNLPFMAPS